MHQCHLVTRATIVGHKVLAIALLAALGCAESEPPARIEIVDADAVFTPGVSQALFNGTDLAGWEADVPAADGGAEVPPSFLVRNGYLTSLGEPRGHLITKRAYANYRLEIEYRFPGDPGNCGVLVHASERRALYEMFPQSIEVQLQAGDAGDFWCIEEDIHVADMELRRPREDGATWGGSEGDARRILNLTDDSERPLGEWNTLVVEADGAQVRVWVNDDLVNHGFDATAQSGQIALQAEGAVVEFRRIDIGPLEDSEGMGARE